jgi:hypothetical protein
MAAGKAWPRQESSGRKVYSEERRRARVPDNSYDIFVMRKSSSFVQGVEGVEICLSIADRIEKRVVRIEGTSGSRFKGIAHKRSKDPPRARISIPGNCPVSVTGTMMTRFIAISGLQNRCGFS